MNFQSVLNCLGSLYLLVITKDPNFLLLCGVTFGSLAKQIFNAHYKIIRKEG